MADLDKAVQTQISNIQQKTGKTLPQLTDLVKKSGKTKHGEIRDFLKGELGIGYGDANLLATLVRDPGAAAPAKATDVTAVFTEIYSGPKAGLRPIHDAFWKQVTKLGGFETAPKKGYVSLRRSRQFAMVGPTTATRVEVGINVKGLKKHARLIDQGAGKMCNYVIRLTDPKEVDAELMAWVKAAYEAAQ